MTKQQQANIIRITSEFMQAEDQVAQRDLVSMAAAATERCRVWPKTAAQDLMCVWAHCLGAGSSCHPTTFLVIFHELIHANVARPAGFLVNCLPVGSVLVVYDTLRIKNRQ